MRVAVVLPPIRDFYLSPRRISALGCRIVAQMLEKAGHSVSLFLFPLLLQGKAHAEELPPEAAYLKEWILPDERGPLSFFTQMKRFGPDWTGCARLAAGENPEAALISSFAYAYAGDAALLARALREQLPQALLVAGGAGPSAWPDYYLEQKDNEGRPLFDAVFSGEAEAGFALLLEFLKSRRNPEQKTLLLKAPAAPRAGISCAFAVQRETQEEAWVSASLCRGCPMGCRFCSNHLCHGREFRTLPPEEIKIAAAGLSGRLAGKRVHLNFEDDNLLLDDRWLRGVLGVFRGLFPGVAFAAENGLDYRLLSENSPGITADELITLGFEKFNLSLASIDEASAAAQGRRTDAAAYLSAAAAITRRGLPLVSYFIAGLETDTPLNLARHLAFLAGAPGIAGISLFYPVPGIAGFDPPPELLRRHPGLARGSLAYPWTGSLSTGLLVTAFRLARLVNLMKKTPRSPQEQELLAACFSEKKLFTLRRTGKKTETGFRIAPVPADRELQKLFFERI
ncbi:MAG: hypothetical protein LBQ57_05260 [Spirochaetales bacterium]|jgi:hypothetical protein|nr:hypothetical protein [Spirochaetales bacterium]